MKDLPTPILGDVTALTITTPDLDKSLRYYQQLGFSEVIRADWPFPWIQVSDGVLLIMLRKDPKPYLALTYYVKNIDEVTKDLDKKGIKFSQKPKKTDALKRYIFESPDGLTISLVGMVEEFSQPSGPGMLQMSPEDYFKPEKYLNKTIGLYGELAHPVTDLDKSLEFWQLLGFKSISVNKSPYPWAIVTDGLSVVGLHQSTHFSYPAITYFAADMPDKIAKLVKVGLNDHKQQSPGNVILTTPEQQHIFLFSLGGAEPKKKAQIAQPIIETERLLLKELNPEIQAELFTTYTDEEIIAFLGLANKDELEVERNNWKLGYSTYRMTFKSFLLQEKETGKIIGKAGFHNWYAMHRRSEMGYALFDEAAKRKGYTTEAVAAIIAYGFDTMNLNRIEAYASPANIASVKILEGAGFIQEGLLRSHFFKNGIMEDSACFGLLRDEYYSRRK